MSSFSCFVFWCCPSLKRGGGLGGLCGWGLWSERGRSCPLCFQTEADRVGANSEGISPRPCRRHSDIPIFRHSGSLTMVQCSGFRKHSYRGIHSAVTEHDPCRNTRGGTWVALPRTYCNSEMTYGRGPQRMKQPFAQSCTHLQLHLNRDAQYLIFDNIVKNPSLSNHQCDTIHIFLNSRRGKPHLSCTRMAFTLLDYVPTLL